MFLDMKRRLLWCEIAGRPGIPVAEGTSGNLKVPFSHCLYSISLLNVRCNTPDISIKEWITISYRHGNKTVF